MATPSFLSNAVATAVKLKNKIQLAGLLTAIVGYVATTIVSPDMVISQIAGGSIGVLILIFGTSLQILQTLPEKSRAAFFLVLFSMTIILVTILLWFTFEVIKNGRIAQIEKDRIEREAEIEAQRVRDSTDKADAIRFDDEQLVSWFKTGVDAVGLPFNPPFLNLSNAEIIAQINQRLDGFLLDAVGTGRQEMVKSLVKRGASVNSENTDYWTPLNLACQKHDLGMVKLLIDLGAKVQKPNSGGTFPIHIANYYPDVKTNLLDEKMVKILVEAGADIDAKDSQGRTLLMSVVSRVCDGTHFPEAAQFLIEIGANPNIKDKYGATVLDYAIKCKAKEPKLLAILTSK